MRRPMLRRKPDETRSIYPSQLWPPVVNPSTLETWVRDAPTARGLPGIARGLALYGGLIGQLALDQVRIATDQAVIPRPRILQKPDLDKPLPSFIGDSVEEFVLHGNTLSLITARDFDGRPAAVKWFPAWQWQVLDNDPRYYLNGRPVDPADVIHVRRGADPNNPRRGVGIVEQNLKTLERVGLQEQYEANSLKEGGVPSVAVIAPQKELTQAEMDEAAQSWAEKFFGPVRRPGIFPNGTQIETLAWSPHDQQLVLARQASTDDIANVMNLDGYWLGAKGTSHTYRSPGAMFVGLLRTSLNPVMKVFEAVWGEILVPAGSTVRFDRLELTRDDFASAVITGRSAVDGGLMTADEWRVMNGLPALGTPEATTLRVKVPAAEPDEPAKEDPPALEIVPSDAPKEGEAS